MILTAKEVFRRSLEPKHLLSALCLFVLLGTTIFAGWSHWITITAAIFLAIAVMSAVHHAEIIAQKIGEGLGTLVLAVSVTIIEVGLIVSLMSQTGGGGASALARDTIFAAIMIITNGIVALCLILGGLKYKEQEFQVQGSNSLLVVLVTLSTLVFVLPNYTVTTPGATYSPFQLGFIGIVCLLLYLLFVFFQTTSHKAYFEPSPDKTFERGDQQVIHDISTVDAWLSFMSLCASLLTVIGLAKVISPIIESGIVSLGAPKSTVGLIIATIVLLPETWAAVNASRANRLQTSLNLALGSGIASIALTIPVVIGYSLVQRQELILGLEPKQMVLLLLTFFVGTLTLGTGRSSLLQGAVHGVILLTYFVLSFVP